MPEIQDIAHIIRRHRKAAKLSQHQLADLAGVGKTVVFDIEKGKETVKLQTLMKVLKVLNISMQFRSPMMGNHIEHEESDRIGEGH